MTRLSDSTDRRNVLVTGSSGFLGRALLRALSLHHDVTPFSRATGGDVLDAEALRAKAIGHDVIVHLAGATSGGDPHVLRANVEGTLNACHAARDANAKLVFASSAAVYEPVNAYGLSKTLAEQAIAWYAERRGLDAAVLRVFNVFGEGATSGVVARFLRDNPLVIDGQGQHVRDFVHVSDVADAFARSLNPEGFFVTDVGTGTGMPIRELATLFDKPIRYAQEPERGTILRSVANDVRIPGWRPTIEVGAWVRSRLATEKASGGHLP